MTILKNGNKWEVWEHDYRGRPRYKVQEEFNSKEEALQYVRSRPAYSHCV